MNLPTVASMKFKFPAFRAIDDGSVEFAIEEAIATCSSGDWVNEANRTLGVTYYAAHMLQLALWYGQSGTGQLVSSEHTPDLSVNYAVPNLSTPGDFDLTIYGKKFKELVSNNFPAVLVVNSGVQM